MSNRRKLRPAYDGSGIKQEVRDKHHAPLPTAAAGEHIWVVTGLWRVADPAAERHELDRENLIAIDGPGCLVCEEVYTPALAARPCTGEPRRP